MTSEADLATRDRASRARLVVVTRIVLVLLALCVAVAFVAIMAGVDQRNLIHRLQSDPYSVSFSEARASDDRADLLNGLWLLSIGLTGVAFVTWAFMQYRRLDDLRDEKRYANWWAIGGWVIPFANLFVPFRIVRDIWNATVGRSKDRRVVRGGEPAGTGFPIVPVWWGLWLVMGVVGFRANDEPTSVSAMLTLNTALLVRNVAVIAAGVLALAVVYRIARAQADLTTSSARIVEETREVGSNSYVTESSDEGGR